jgi:hypothetical protein
MSDPMGDIDEASRPQVPGTATDPIKPIPSLSNANYGGINSTNVIPYEQQCPGSTVDYVTPYNDDVAQYQKATHDGLMTIRNSAYNAAVPNNQTPLVGKTDSDPPGDM